jgi:outer membrane protein assembly factor BamB
MNKRYCKTTLLSSVPFDNPSASSGQGRANGIYKRNLKLYILVALALILSACGDEDNSEPPAELTSFEASASMELLWSSYANEGIGQQFLLIEPLLLDDKIVTAGRDGFVSVISKDDGEILKEIDLDSVLSGGVGGNDKIWLFATRDGELVAVDAATGKISWKVNVPSEVLSRPVLYKNTVLVRTVDGQVVSLDLATGKTRWNYQQTKPPLTLRGSSSPVLARDRVYVGLANGRLVSLLPENGEVIWDVAQTVPQGHSEIQRLVDIDGHAELYGHVLYAASYQGRVTAIDVLRGQFLWARPFSSYTGVTIDDKNLYSSDDRSHVWAIDRFNGATLWKQEKLQARNITRPVLIGDYVVVGDFDGYLHVMSRFDGHFVARVSVGDNTESDIGEYDIGDRGIIVPPQVDGNDIFVTTRNGMLYAYSINKLVPAN